MDPMIDLGTKTEKSLLQDYGVAKSNILVVASGGLDSATVMALAQLRVSTTPFRVKILFFDYGQKPWEAEHLAAENLSGYICREPLRNLKIPHLVNKSDTMSIISTKEEDTIYPCRNLIFLAYAAHYACEWNCGEIGIGAHQGDAGYPDTRPGFLAHTGEAIRLGSGNLVTLWAPLSGKSKVEILKMAVALGVPLEDTSSCYHAYLEHDEEIVSCGKCPSCLHRLKAFEALSMKDPITYQEAKCK